MDYISVLTVRSPRDALMTKKLFRATNGAIGKTGYGNAMRFDVEQIAIDGLAELVAVLADLAWRTDCFVIRGRPLAHDNVRRRVHGADAAFVAERDGHHWFMMDCDEVPLPMFLEPDDDPELLLRFLARLLPPAFHDASFYWQWSCGQGIDRWRTLRAHLWFWSKDKHTDAELERWAQWINGNAGWKIIDPVVMRTVQPNYVSAPVIGDGVVDPVPGDRQGIYIGATDEVVLEIPTQKWDDHMREVERAEYEELVEYGLRQPYSSLDLSQSDEKYLEYLCRIGDDMDGFYEPMTKAIWHWARSNSPDRDDAFKTVLRQVVREARCTKQRDLDTYLSDYRLDASLRGAREKQADFQPKPKSTFAELMAALRRDSFTRKALSNR